MADNNVLDLDAEALRLVNPELARLNDELEQAIDLYQRLKDVQGENAESTQAVADKIKEIKDQKYDEEIRQQNQQIEQQIQKFNNLSDTIFSGLGKAFSFIADIVSKATENNTKYFQSLNQIVGITGSVGQLGQTLRDVASGVVSKQDLADFFGQTGDIIRGAEAMGQQASFARDLIAAYGDVSVAAQKYRQIQLLSIEDQQIAIGLVQKQAQAVEQSAAGQIRTIQTQMQEAMDSIGSSILYTIRPIVEFLGQVANAFADLSGLSKLGDETTAAANVVYSAEEQRVLDLMNEIERLKATGFLSSLDEVHDTGGNVLVEAQDENKEQEDAEKVEEAEKTKQDAMSETSAKAREIAESLYSIIQIVMELGSVFGEIFATIGDDILDIVAFLGQMITKILKVIDSLGLTKPVIVAVTGAVLGLAAARAALAIAQIAGYGPAAPAVAAMVGTGVAIGAAALMGVGLAIGGNSSSSVSVPDTSNQSMDRESQKPQINIYMDGKLVNDTLEQSKAYSTEVVFT